MSIKVAIVEDDKITRETLSKLVSRADELLCTATYGTAEDAIREVPKNLPDVLLCDINLPGRSGIQCVAALKSAQPDLLVLMLTTYDDTENIFDSLRAGASGYLLKRNIAAELIPAIHEVQKGGSPMSMNIARKVVSYFRPDRPTAAPEIQTLTPREHEILTLLAKGCLQGTSG